MDDEKNYQNYLKKIKLFQKYNKHYYDLNQPLVDDYQFDKLKLEIIDIEKKIVFQSTKTPHLIQWGLSHLKFLKK